MGQGKVDGLEVESRGCPMHPPVTHLRELDHSVSLGPGTSGRRLPCVLWRQPLSPYFLPSCLAVVICLLCLVLCHDG